MSRHLHRHPVTILSTATEGILDPAIGLKMLAQATALSIIAPDTIDGVASVQFAHKEDPAAGDWAPANPAITLPVNTETPIPLRAVAALKIVQTVAAAADRVYWVVAQLDVTDGFVR